MDIEKIKTQMCDNYCKHFAEIRATFEDIDRGQEELDRICEHCPLNELEDVVPKEDITQKDWTDYWHKLSQSYAHTICVMSQAIAEYSEKRWIPCSERLPEEDMRIIAQYGDGSFGVIERVRLKIWNLINSPYAKVVAWMQMPEPWRVRREDGEIH